MDATSGGEVSEWQRPAMSNATSDSPGLWRGMRPFFSCDFGPRLGCPWSTPPGSRESNLSSSLLNGAGLVPDGSVASGSSTACAGCEPGERRVSVGVLDARRCDIDGMKVRGYGK